MSSSAKRALRILETIGRAGRPLGVSEIARMLALPAGTVFRSLDALHRADLIARYQASSRYVLGGAAERLRRSLIARFRMREVVLPYLRQLASISGETASLHARLGWYGVRIASAPGTGEVTNAPPLGETHPLGEHYAGEAILAFLTDAAIARYCAWAAARGLRPLQMERELGAVKERGFALSEADFEEGASIAFPIRSGAGEAIAALAIEGPVFARNKAQTGDLSGWREIVAHVEALARTQGSLFENPFPHLNPDSLIF
jgi:DNA-binding IclR family transcriptional regulator